MRNFIAFSLLLFCVSAHSTPNGLYPITGFDPGLPSDDLKPFAETLDGVSIVGLGESVHTSRGYYEAKRRLIQYLTELQGFRMVLMETPMMAAFHATEYVSLCNGTADDAVTSVFNVFQDIATRDMLKNLCEYNRSHPNDRVSFFGFDIQEADTMIHVQNVLKENALDSDGSITSGLNRCLVKAQSNPAKSFDEINKMHKDCLKAIELATDRVKNLLPALSGWQKFLLERALYGSRMYENQIYYNATGDGVKAENTRDEGMSNNIKAFYEFFGSGKKAIVWAHNGHNQTMPYYGPVKSCGTWLKESYGKKYASYSLTGYHVQINWPYNPGMTMNHSEYPRVANSIESTLHKMGLKFAFVDSLGPWLKPDTPYYFRDGDNEVPSQAHRGIFYLDESPGNIYVH
jgi:erythromycin esterase